MKKTIVVILINTLFSICYAQKIGHMNSGNLLSQMPETAKADSVIKIYQNDLMLKGDTLAKSFETEYKAFVEAYNAGTLSAQQAQKRQEYLQKQQQLLQTYAQDVDEKVGILRKQLLQPILMRLDQVLREVAKENGYEMIFDTSTGATLFAQEGDDVTPLVKVKLGLK